MEQIRHTYLHYLLDPLAMKYPSAMKRLEPLLESVKAVAHGQQFQERCLAAGDRMFYPRDRSADGGIEPRRPKRSACRRLKHSAQQGFILTHYFYEALVKFEKDPAGLSQCLR